MQVKQPLEDRKKKDVYEEPYEGCERVYIRETSKTREKNGLAAQAWTNQHQVDWKAAKTKEMEGIILEEEGAGSPAHPLPAAHL